ncbi:MAG: hypothetical protein V4700_04550 [Pseudomonadota bacterium]
MTEMYREPNQKLLQGKHFSVIVDRGELKKAVRDSSGNYLFSEVGAGVKPLVLIGTMQEIVKFLYEKRKLEIHNTIKSLPFIYMSASYYHPKERFEGIFPIHQAIDQFTKALLDFAPIPDNVETVTDILGNAETLQSALRDIFSSSKKKQFPESKLIYLKISYFKDEGAVEVGEKVVPLASILYKLLGVKETRV